MKVFSIRLSREFEEIILVPIADSHDSDAFADEMWTFGSKSMSRGCMIEKRYCERYKIPIIERGDYVGE